ncbi:DNA-binding LytR/AlgR family response regulator [Chitinophaga sp. W3I9]|uniref:LytTR family transcriptional regulator DNA-binding domain-containing protein n=1 Tax=unclassified Chitinophaga TaxID=2619133 RepID=UPI003D254042
MPSIMPPPFKLKSEGVTAEEKLQVLPDLFFRTHHSHIINLQYIKRYIRGEGGQIELENGVYVTVSRRKKEELLKKFRYKK